MHAPDPFQPSCRNRARCGEIELPAECGRLGVGAGGGGAGSTTGGSAGTTNTGSGGGAGGNASPKTGGAGGSGVVVLRMATSDYSGTTSGSPTITTSGSDTILLFNADGSYTA